MENGRLAFEQKGYVEYEFLKKTIEELTDTVSKELLASKEFERQEIGDSYMENRFVLADEYEQMLQKQAEEFLKFLNEA